MLDTHGRKYVDPLIEGISKQFNRFGFQPNHVTILAFLVGISSGIGILFRLKALPIVLLWISGLLDAVDGALARKQKTTSPLGTLMDITFDRIVEITIIIALAYRYPDLRFQLILLSSSIIISMTVFLTVGALTENKGKKSFYYQAGLMERTEGFIMFSLMIIFSKHIKAITIIYSLLIIFTVYQRIKEAKKLFNMSSP